MAAYASFACPATARQPPACPTHTPSCSYTSSASAFRRGATPLTAAASPSAQRSCGRRSLVVRSDQRSEFEQRIEREDAARDAEAQPSMEQQIEMLRAQGPPAGMSPEDFEKQIEAYQQAMSDPESRKQLEQMQEMAQQPEMQEQMAQMASVMQNKQLMERMQELRGSELLQRMEELKGDPDIAPFFQAVQSGGMAALQSYMANPEFLAKLGNKLGDIDMSLPGEGKPAGGAAAATPSAGAPGAPPPPEIENLLQAAKHGDLEATEDLIAVGHDVNATDAEKRTPLHYAVAYRHMQIAEELLKGGADIGSTDSKGNTPLHYAAGYGRGEFVARLIEAGANGKAKNDSDHTPFEIVSMEQRNPLNQEAETFEQLKAAAGM